MAERFGESVAPTDALNAILGSYPFSIGLLREFLQNSDDAGATKQIFVLDKRTHSSESVYHQYLSSTQGPSLIAFNDADISPEDWRALKNIHRSSKKTDTSKIGKYGIGFRSCYHITDHPHILSGSHLAILDPQHDFAEDDGGVKFNIQSTEFTFDDHLIAFESVLSNQNWRSEGFNGSAFRLPLRTSPSPISSKTISTSEISELLRSFALEELDVSLLFLRHIESIELHEIDETGTRTMIARAVVEREDMKAIRSCESRKATITVARLDASEQRASWRFIRAPFSEEEAMRELSSRLSGADPKRILTQHKLNPTIELAIPLDNRTSIGRLFTFLPLPLRTEFPVQINGLFSLTQSRQNLRNAGEVGIVKGSDDQALIEWNRLLFDSYVPQAWANLLQLLIEENEIKNVLDAWPTLQAKVNSGDYVYWKDMPNRIVHYSLELPVWPVFGSNPTSYTTLSSALIAEEREDKNILFALTRAGLSIVRLPEYLVASIRTSSSSSLDTNIMIPENVQRFLQGHTQKCSDLNIQDAQCILSYLLSLGDCRYVIGIPLVESVGKTRIALESRNQSSNNHVLLGKLEEELFGSYDLSAISLEQLPSLARGLFTTPKKHSLNVCNLDRSHIARYLSQTYSSEAENKLLDDQVEWLNKFWKWSHKSKIEGLLTTLESLYLVPITLGSTTPREVIFDAGNDTILAGILQHLRIFIIDARMTHKASFTNLKQSADVYSLVHAFPANISDVSVLLDDAKHLCQHLIEHLPSSRALKGSVSQRLNFRSRLRALPIYPRVSSSNGNVVNSRSYIPATATVKGVYPSTISISSLPVISNYVFIDLDLIDRNFLRYLDDKDATPLNRGDLVDLMLKHFDAQSFETQVAFTGYLASESHLVTPHILDQLAGKVFVRATDGSMQAPNHLIDPNSTISRLYPLSSSALPDTSRASSTDLIVHLRRLGLLVRSLSTDIVRDRITYIANNRSENIARILLEIMYETQFDCQRLFDSSLQNLEWIPTSSGLKNLQNCRDTASHQNKSYLFDECMSMVVRSVQVRTGARRALGWEGEVSFSIILNQLRAMVNNYQALPYEKMHMIVKELASRKPSEAEIASLHSVLQGRKWVPGRNRELYLTSRALLSDADIPEIGFVTVVSLEPRMMSFLGKMGCKDRPDKDTIIQYLCDVPRTSTRSSTEVHGMLRLLHWLPDLLTQEDREKLFLPDKNRIMQPCPSICYNDVGERLHLIDIGDRLLAHPNITLDLATKLGLQPLGLLAINDEDELDMGEDLVTTIRNRLREYTDSQLLLEFVANASDAGATEFNVLVDGSNQWPDEYLINDRCAEFQQTPALVIHNNSTFTDADFKGILQTGIGGKTGKTDTIGQFGLGSLTMFHITEFAMIVSGDHVLFLNPCKGHLPAGRASLRRPLSLIRKMYPDHLAPLIGMFKFNPPKDYNEPYKYEGTLFRLPLRSSGGLPRKFPEPVFTRVPSLHVITATFSKTAQQCVLFTKIEHISLWDRFENLPLRAPRWTVTAKRNDFTTSGDLSAHYLTTSFTSKPSKPETWFWRVMSLNVQRDFPNCMKEIRDKYRLREPVVARIAAPISSPTVACNLFSTLPLPATVDIPAHLSAPFVISSDRRSIRLDHYGNHEATYNQWLLTDIIPKLYLHLLEDRATLGNNFKLWPGNEKSLAASSENYDSVTRIIMDAIFIHAAATDLSIFRSQFHPHALSPKNAHIPYRLPSAVDKVIESLKPSDIVKPPSSLTRRLCDAKGRLISLVDPPYIQKLLQHTEKTFADTPPSDDLHSLIEYLIVTKGEKYECDALIGLRLLPLEDGSIANFDRDSEPCFYFDPRNLEDPIFKSSRLIHHGLDTRVVSKLLKCSNLNVKKITATNIGSLLEDYVPHTPTLRNAIHEVQEWIEKFWDYFSQLSLQVDAIASYPLLQTVKRGFFVSISQASDNHVVIANFAESDEWLSNCLVQMEFNLVNAIHLPQVITSHIKHSISTLNLETIAGLIIDHPSRSEANLFDSLDADLRVELTEWFKTRLDRKVGSWFSRKPQYRRLPLWLTVSGTYVSATSIQMLPYYMRLQAISPFASGNIVEYSSILQCMGTEPQKQILPLLSLPHRLQRDKEAEYRALVEIFLNNSSESLPFPNSERLLKNTDLLYSSRDPLFVAAFGEDSDNFILDSFRYLERRLHNNTLKREAQLDMDMFTECVEGFSQSAFGPSMQNRAAVIFQAYSEDLPLRVPASKGHLWTTLDKYRFIPREMSAKPLGNIAADKYMETRLRSMKSVVKPEELAREEFRNISWTQRAFYATEPHQRVMMAYPQLSVPTVAEVVEHLVILATKVAMDHPQNQLVLTQIEATYRWLNEHAGEARGHLDKHKRKKILLNVDDPSTEGWDWQPPEKIWLEAFDTGFCHYPRRFISQFHSFIVAAGVVKVEHGTQNIPAVEATTDGMSFEEMRQKRICTDVRFIFEDEDDKEEIFAHRSYLAGYCTYFRDMFSGEFAEAGNASTSNPIEIKISSNYSRGCVEQTIKYAYTDGWTKPKEELFTRLNDQDLDLALEILEFTNFTSMAKVQQAAENVIISLKLVNPFNLDRVLHTAKTTNSKSLIQHCEAYEGANATIVARVRNGED